VLVFTLKEFEGTGICCIILIAC